jgi:bifunctional DNase/RNase
MATQLIPLNFSKIMQSKSYTVVVLGDEKKRFAIYMEPQVGKTLLSFLSEEKRPRPLSHELFFSILDNLNVKVLQVVIHNLEDTIYFARVFLEQQINEKKHILEIDGRSSDAILLAMLCGSPILCTPQVLTESIPFEE